VRYRLGIDVGGTFTDLFLHDGETGKVWLAKTPTTPQDQAVGVLDGVSLIGETAGVAAEELGALLHGTTVATNAVLERRGARAGLLTTEGFGHILHLAEAWTPGPLFGFMIYQKPEPLVAYEDVYEIRERIAADGTVVRALDEPAARRVLTELRDAGVDAITISLLNSYANPSHEHRLAELAAEIAPDIPVSVSSTVMSEFREYERTVTTVVNAYVAPALNSYLSSLQERLEKTRAGADVQVVRSDGGLMSLEAACSMPVHTVLSGPAGGVSGASYVAARAGFDTILTFDMGGTSTDVAVCRGGTPTITRETHVGDFPVRAPAVDVASIGAGGGSIAFIQAATGSLKVGPRSAGADPGPACYGRGGVEPTVTDANVVLGHLPPRLLGGAMKLDVGAAHEAVRRVAEPLGLTVEAAAAGIVDLVNEAMLGALRVVTVQRGHDPGAFALVSFGGAGGLHANALARLLGSYPVIVPREAGVLSAVGFVASDIKNEFGQTFVRTTDEGDPAELQGIFGELDVRAQHWLEAEGVAADARRVEFEVDMRYEQQGYEISIPLARDDLEALDLSQLARTFADHHHRLYGFSLDGGAEVVNLRARAVGSVRGPEVPAAEPGTADPRNAQTDTHAVWTPAGTIVVPCYARDALRAGMKIDGYAIIEQYDSTTVVLPGHIATVDPWLNLLITPA
jgi:N-methylhydantoinase A